jgi:L-alanine-DL-glutamate epimerase-like enolase superfamily enzyme
MKIASLETFSVDGGMYRYHFLKLTTDDGLTGWSEFNDPGPGYGALGALIRAMSHRVMGEDPRNPRRLVTDLNAAARISSGGLYVHAVAAIENACLDIAARALGVPVYQMLGGALRTELPLYWSHCGWYRVRPKFCEATGLPRVRSLDDVEALGAEVRARGFRALKTNLLRFHEDVGTGHYPGIAPVGAGPALNASPDLLQDTVELMAAFRRGAGDDVDLMIDANFNFRSDGFVRLARALEPFGMRWLECDLPDAPSLAALRRATSTPIGSLETVLTGRDFAPFMEARAVDVAIIDVMWCGLLESMAMADLAAAYETSVATHGYTGPLATAMCAHFAALIPNLSVMEYDVDGHPIRDSLVKTLPRIEGGFYHLPDGPGWGVEVDEAAIERHLIPHFEQSLR